MTRRPSSVRMKILMVTSIAVALVIFIRFAFIMLSPNKKASVSNRAPAVAERGSIVDRNGRLIALQTRLYSVAAWKPEIEDSVKIGNLLGAILDMEPGSISQMLADNRTSRFVFIKRQVTPTQSDKIRELIEEGQIPGISLQEEFGRHYPMKELAAPLIGYVGTDNIGLAGLEYSFNRILAPGSVTAAVDRIYGNSLHLTLDMNVQFLVENIAQEAWEDFSPDSMMILILDAKTAEILAWVSRPSYDPNTFAQSNQNQRINRPLAIAYEPGSVFKVFSWSVLLDIGAAGSDDTFHTASGYEPEAFTKYGIPPITDIHNYGILSLSEAIILSSNVAVASASENISDTDFYRSLKNFGFGNSTGLPLSGESQGLLNPVSNWSARSKPTIAIGQEVGVSAIQVAAAATTLANGGILLNPRIVSKVVAADGSLVKEYPRNPVREVISPKTAKLMLNLMEQTVISPLGTSRKAAVPGLRISAKSGTAQITDPKTGQYSSDRFLSSVLGLFPTDDPQLIVYIVLENSRSVSIFGAQTAAPMLKEIAQTLAPFYGIPLAGNTVLEHSGQVRIDNPKPLPLGKELHDLTGYSKRMLLPYLERDDINLIISGNGWVVFQFPPPGTPIENGMNIYLELK